MRQYDVFENPATEARRFAPFVVVLSSHLLLDFHDAVVAPLVNDAGRTVPGLEVDVEVEGEPLVCVVSELSSIDGRYLRRHVGSLSAYDYDLRRALDRLFTGF